MVDCKQGDVVKKVQGDFFNWASPENVSRMAPPKKNALTAPPPHFEKVLSMAAERGDSEYFNIFDT